MILGLNPWLFALFALVPVVRRLSHSARSRPTMFVVGQDLIRARLLAHLYTYNRWWALLVYIVRISDWDTPGLQGRFNATISTTHLPCVIKVQYAVHSSHDMVLFVSFSSIRFPSYKGKNSSICFISIWKVFCWFMLANKSGKLHTACGGDLPGRVFFPWRNASKFSNSSLFNSQLTLRACRGEFPGPAVFRDWALQIPLFSADSLTSSAAESFLTLLFSLTERHKFISV